MFVRVYVDLVPVVLTLRGWARETNKEELLLLLFECENSEKKTPEKKHNKTNQPAN